MIGLESTQYHQYDGKHDTVSLYRLKPVYLDSGFPATTPTATTAVLPTESVMPTSNMDSTPQTAHSGQQVHWPKHFTHTWHSHWEGSDVVDEL